MKTLSENEIKEKLNHLSGWVFSENSIVKNSS